MAVTGFIDGYYSYNANHPGISANGQMNDLYNFNDKTDTSRLSAAMLTLNHDPSPFGAHFEFLYGRTNGMVNAGSQANYIEQAFLSLKPPAAKGFEMDFGKFVTSAGAEVIEAKDDWNYSRSLLFAWAIPYTHFGLRTSMPVSSAETVGVQLVNGWNQVTRNNGWATAGFTNSFATAKYTWNVTCYTGPENAAIRKGYRNLLDTTLLLTPNPKFSTYINYDLGNQHDSIVKGVGDTQVNSWQGIAMAAHLQLSKTSALAGRYEYFNDPDGFMTGATQHVNEFTTTYEFKPPKYPRSLLSRLEYRHDQSNVSFFHKGNTALVGGQSTLTLGFVAIFSPHAE